MGEFEGGGGVVEVYIRRVGWVIIFLFSLALVYSFISLHFFPFFSVGAWRDNMSVAGN